MLGIASLASYPPMGKRELYSLFATHGTPGPQPRCNLSGASRVVPPRRPDAVYREASVTEHPMLLSSPPPYPELMRMAGIRGRVLLEAIVDTVGRVEPSSIRILASPSPGFDEPTRRWAASARFRPARLEGRAVRVLVNLPIDFATTSGG